MGAVSCRLLAQPLLTRDHIFSLSWSLYPGLQGSFYVCGLLLVLNQRNSLKTPNSRSVMTRTQQTPHAATYLWSGSCSHEGMVSKPKLEWGTHSVYRVLSLPHCLQIWGKDKRPPAYKGKKNPLTTSPQDHPTAQTPHCLAVSFLSLDSLLIKIFLYE